MSHFSRIRAVLAIGATIISPAIASAADCAVKIDPKLLTEPGKLTLAVSPTLPPMAYADSTGQLKGLRIELGDEIAHRLCLEPHFISTEYASMIPGLNGGRWDAVDAGLFVTPERLKILYMIPYENLAVAVSTQKNGPKFEKPEDLSGHSISTDVSGYDAAKMRGLSDELVAKGMKPIEIHLFDNYATVFQALRAGQVEAAVSIDPVAKQYQETGDFALALHGLYATPGSVSMVNPDVAKAITKVMQDMEADGWLPALMTRYGVEQAAGGIVLKGMGL